MSQEFYQHTDYPKISGEYTKADIKTFMSTLNLTDDKGTVYTIDEIMEGVVTYNNYCSYAKISVDAFTIYWRISNCERQLTKLASVYYPQGPDGEIKFPVLDKIYAIATSLHVEEDPFDDYEEAFYFDKNGLLKIARTLRLVDPCDDNDDGDEIILYEGMDETLYDDMINDFFYRTYIRYMCDLPDDLKKPITKMTPEEYQVFLMYII